MSDVKDILGVGRSGGGPDAKPEKAKEAKLVKPKGMSREAFALLSASHPLAPSQLVGDLRKKDDLAALKAKAKRSHRGQVTFELRKFSNPGRADGLELTHWVKCYRDAAGHVTPADEGEYPFAKYNKKVQVYRYNDEEWASLVAPEAGWAREETDYLIALAASLDLRWIVVADRYAFPGGAPRSVEDLKARYYGVARQLLVGREGGRDTLANHPLVRQPFNPAHERERKRGLELLMARTPAQDAEEKVILDEAAAIEAKRKAEAAARRAAAPATAAGPAAPGSATAVTPAAPVTVSEFLNEPPVGTPPLFDMTAAAVAPAGVLTAATRGAHTKEMVEAHIAALQPPKHQKAVEGSMAELKQEAFPRCPTRAVAGAYVALLGEVDALLSLKQRLAQRQASATGAKRAAKREADEDADAGTPRSEKRQRVAKKYGGE